MGLLRTLPAVRGPRSPLAIAVPPPRPAPFGSLPPGRPRRPRSSSARFRLRSSSRDLGATVLRPGAAERQFPHGRRGSGSCLHRRSTEPRVHRGREREALGLTRAPEGAGSGRADQLHPRRRQARPPVPRRRVPVPAPEGSPQDHLRRHALRRQLHDRDHGSGGAVGARADQQAHQGCSEGGEGAGEADRRRPRQWGRQPGWRIISFAHAQSSHSVRTTGS